jgi:phenylpyruvate C(3)-methyltransferase
MSSLVTGAAAPDTWIRGPVADLFSSYIAASALSAAHELGLLDRLATGAPAAYDGTDDHELDARVVHALYGALGWAGVVTITDGRTVSPGPRFDEAYAARGYFYWLVRGCGEVLTEAPALAWTRHRTGEFYHRDMRAVALGSRLIGDTEVEALFDTVLAKRPATKVVDLGCGSGQRLIRIAGHHPGTEGIGIDIAADAVRLATAAVSDSGLRTRIAIHHADARVLDPIPAYADVDTVTCVFMGHDFWPYDSCVRTLRRLRSAFPAVERLLLCDVTRTSEPPGPQTTIFTLGFELMHALMGVYVPTFAEWQRAFAAGGWTCVAVHPTTAPPNGYLFDLAPSA